MIDESKKSISNCSILSTDIFQSDSLLVRHCWYCDSPTFSRSKTLLVDLELNSDFWQWYLQKYEEKEVKVGYCVGFSLCDATDCIWYNNKIWRNTITREGRLDFNDLPNLPNFTYIFRQNSDLNQDIKFLTNYERSLLLFDLINYHDWTEVLKLTEDYLDLAEETNIKGQLPMEVAIKNNCTTDVLVALMQPYKKSLVKWDNCNCIRHAVDFKADVQILKILLTEFPNQTHKVYSESLLPLHIALANQSSDEIIFLLLDFNPEEAACVTVTGHIALHLAIINKSSLDVVMSLLKAYPDGARTLDPHGSLPIHLAIKLQAEVAVVNALMNAFPEGVQTCDRYGNLPLYLSLMHKSEIGVIQKLLEVYPETTSMKIDSFHFAIHVALIFGTTVEIVKYLMTVCPNCLADVNRDGDVALHVAVSYNASEEIVTVIIQSNPNAAQIKNLCGSLPIHLAASNNATVNVLQQLLEVYREGSGMKNDIGLLPVHLAILSLASIEVVSLLFDAFPTAVGETNADGELPLHKSVLHRSSKALVSMVYHRNPSAVHIADLNGDLPLHKAAKHGSSLSVIRLLIKAFPEGVKRTNLEGNLPIHNAAGKKGTALNVITELLHLYPESVRMKNTNGFLPLHKAISVKPSAAVCELLLNAYPESIKERIMDDDLPLHEAASCGCPLPAMLLLISRFPQAITMKNKDGNLPLHYAAGCKSIHVDVLKELIRLYPDGMVEKNNNGYFPLYLALLRRLPFAIIATLLAPAPFLVRSLCIRGRLPSVYAYSESVYSIMNFVVDSLRRVNGKDYIRIHICGPPAAGKSTLNDLLLRTIGKRFHTNILQHQFTKRHVPLPPPLSDNGRPMEPNDQKFLHISKISRKCINLLLMDYQGIESSHSTAPYNIPYLACAWPSIYILVLPLHDFTTAASTPCESLVRWYENWLRLVNSVAVNSSTCITILNLNKHLRQHQVDNVNYKYILNEIKAMQQLFVNNPSCKLTFSSTILLMDVTVVNLKLLQLKKLLRPPKPEDLKVYKIIDSILQKKNSWPKICTKDVFFEKYFKPVLMANSQSLIQLESSPEYNTVFKTHLETVSKSVFEMLIWQLVDIGVMSVIADKAAYDQSLIVLDHNWLMGLVLGSLLAKIKANSDEDGSRYDVADNVERRGMGLVLTLDEIERVCDGGCGCGCGGTSSTTGGGLEEVRGDVRHSDSRAYLTTGQHLLRSTCSLPRLLTACGVCLEVFPVTVLNRYSRRHPTDRRLYTKPHRGGDQPAKSERTRSLEEIEIKIDAEAAVEKDDAAGSGHRYIDATTTAPDPDPVTSSVSCDDRARYFLFPYFQNIPKSDDSSGDVFSKVNEMFGSNSSLSHRYLFSLKYPKTQMFPPGYFSSLLILSSQIIDELFDSWNSRLELEGNGWSIISEAKTETETPLESPRRLTLQLLVHEPETSFEICIAYFDSDGGGSNWRRKLEECRERIKRMVLEPTGPNSYFASIVVEEIL